MKSNKAITITSLLVYLVAMTIVIATLATIASTFYKNIDSTEATVSSAYSYMKLTSYLVKEINTNANEVIYPSNQEEASYIIFSKTNNQYEFKDESIYMNKVKICTGIKKCVFSYSQDEKLVNVKIKTTEDKTENQYTYENKYHIVNI